MEENRKSNEKIGTPIRKRTQSAKKTKVTKKSTATKKNKVAQNVKALEIKKSNSLNLVEDKTKKENRMPTTVKRKKHLINIQEKQLPAIKEDFSFKKENLKIIPLGGIEEIGKNITVFEYGNDIVLVDCGVAFPEEDMLGIDLVIPDFSYLEKNKEKIRGLVVTHGHEDHIGSIAYLLKQINVPIYSTKLTIEIGRAHV